jgi:hypothetical protein
LKSKDEWKEYVINFQICKQHYFELKLVKAIKDKFNHFNSNHLPQKKSKKDQTRGKFEKIFVRKYSIFVNNFGNIHLVL